MKLNKYIKYFLIIVYTFSLVGFSQVAHICHGEVHSIYVNTLVEGCECNTNSSCEIEFNHKIKQENCCQNIIRYIKLSEWQLKKSNDYNPLFTITNYLTENLIKDPKITDFISTHIIFTPKDKPIFIRDCSLLI